VTVIYFVPWEKEKNGGVQCPLGLFLFVVVMVAVLLLFAENKYPPPSSSHG